MRAIKCRQLVNGTWHYWGYLPGGFIEPPITGTDPPESYQYTGLKDANGTEIYEGDVLEHESGGLRVVVEWDAQEWCEDGFYTGYLLTFTSDQYTIIGNIHQSPELVEKEKE